MPFWLWKPPFLFIRVPSYILTRVDYKRLQGISLDVLAGLIATYPVLFTYWILPMAVLYLSAFISIWLSLICYELWGSSFTKCYNGYSTDSSNLQLILFCIKLLNYDPNYPRRYDYCSFLMVSLVIVCSSDSSSSLELNDNYDWDPNSYSSYWSCNSPWYGNMMRVN